MIMTKNLQIQAFNNRKVRTVWDNDKEEWYFSVVDVVGILTDSSSPNTYWKVLKNRLKKEGNETVTNCNQLKLLAAGRTYTRSRIQNSMNRNKMILKKMRKTARWGCGITMAIVMAACNGSDIAGEWVEPIPGMEDQIQGISLNADGTASSINMATLQYETWKREGDNLILSGKSIGNGQTISFSDTLLIKNLTDEEMSLTRGEVTITYRKR